MSTAPVTSTTNRYNRQKPVGGVKSIVPSSQGMSLTWHSLRQTRESKTSPHWSEKREDVDCKACWLCTEAVRMLPQTAWWWGEVTALDASGRDTQRVNHTQSGPCHPWIPQTLGDVVVGTQSQYTGPHMQLQFKPGALKSSCISSE